MNARELVVGVERVSTGWLGYGADRALYAAALRLPKAVALGMCEVPALIDCFLTLDGLRFRRELRVTHGVDGARAFRMAWRRARAVNRDLVLTARLAAERDPWPAAVRHSGGEDVLAHIASGGSLVVTGGHFPWYFSVMAPLSVSSGPRSVMIKTLEPGPVLARREGLRIGLVAVQAIELQATVVWVNWAAGADASLLKSLVRRLRGDGALAVLLIDAPAGRWDGFSRPFAGQLSRNVPLGPARIARAAGSALANVAVVPERNGTLRFHWSRLIRPDQLHETDGVLTAMNSVADHLEWAVGKFRWLYGPGTGRERRWDATAERWV
jgi:hypothetical protein